MFKKFLLAPLIFTSAMLASSICNADLNYSAIVVEERTGQVLFARNADRLQNPGALAKIMTSYLLFERSNKWSLNSKLTLGSLPRFAGPTMGLQTAKKPTGKQLLEGLIVGSANDAAAAVAAYISGSEDEFGNRMTARAKSLGMSRTIYRGSGAVLVDGSQTTARDQARLAIAIRRDFPDYFKFFNKTNATYGSTTLTNPNNAVVKFLEVDGIHAGPTPDGYASVVSVESNNIRLIGVLINDNSVSQAKHESYVQEILNKSLAKLGAPPLTTQAAGPALGKGQKTTDSEIQKCTTTQDEKFEIYDNCLISLIPDGQVDPRKRNAIINKCKRISCNPSILDRMRY